MLLFFFAGVVNPYERSIVHARAPHAAAPSADSFHKIVSFLPVRYKLICPPSFDEVSNGHGNHLPPRAPRDSQKDSIRSPQRARMHPPNFKGAVTRDVEGIKASAWRRRGHPSFSYVNLRVPGRAGHVRTGSIWFKPLISPEVREADIRYV